MIFLVEYSRSLGKLVSFDSFKESDRRLAQDAKLELELTLHQRGVQHEVVLLEADDEAELRRSYRRYFEDLRAILETAARIVAVAPTAN